MTRKNTEISRSRNTDKKKKRTFTAKYAKKEKQSKGRGPFGKLRDQVTEALARHSRVGGNPERYTLQRMDPRIREDDKST